jgi:ribosome biogenesis GTPase A
MSFNQTFSHGKKHASSMTSRGRKSKKLENISKQRKKYPLLAENIVLSSDIILEVLDSRFINETRNSEIEGLIEKANKQIIYVFNKSDLIDRQKVDAEYKTLKPRVFVSCVKREGIKELRDKIKILSKRLEEHVDKRGVAIIGVVGYPNTGKSSVINLLSGKNASRVGSEAGFTKGIIKVKLTPEILLLDSPGIIPNHAYSTSETQALSQHTKLGARGYNQVSNPAVVVSNLMKEYAYIIEKFYEINAKGDSDILIETLGRKKNFLLKGNQVDEDKTARLILRDWQEGKIRK